MTKKNPTKCKERWPEIKMLA